jgi:acetyl esterase/lipase
MLSSGCLAYYAVKPAPLPAGGRRVLDVAYYHGAGFDPDKHRLDLYLPPGTDPHPVLLFVHGGYWVTGGRREDFGIYARLGRRLAAHGVLTAVISYRLSPAVQYPEHERDVARAIAFVSKHARQFGGDPKRLFVAGHSAGGHLAVLAGTDPRWLREQGLRPRDLAGVIGISGVYDVEDLANDATDRDSHVLPVFGKDAAVWHDASPQAQLPKDASLLPPMLIATGDADVPKLRNEARRFAETLRAMHAQVVEREIADRDHRSVIVRFAEDDDPLGEDVLAFMQASAPQGNAKPR